MFGWRGILAEPGRSWHAALKADRSAIIDIRCVSSETGKTLMFEEAAQLGQSSISKGPKSERPTYPVKTVSLTDLLQEHRAPRKIDYLSVDTEGSEFEILNAFDFDKYKFGFISVEQHRDDHPVTSLLENAGYKVMYRREPDLINWSQVSGFDSWYIPN
jgi:FkbM family methyltransferase